MANAGFPSTILAAAGLTEIPSAAVRYSAQIAAACDARVVELHVHHFETPPNFTQAQSDELQRQFACVTGEVRRAIEHQVSEAGRQTASDQATTIVHAAAGENRDPIVMGAHGRQGIEQFMLGSVERVLSSSSVPVLTVREQSDQSAVRNIRCPVNHSNASREAFVKAARIARCFGARLMAVHIDEVPATACIDVCAWIGGGEQPQCDVHYLRAACHGAKDSSRIRVVRRAACPVLTVSAATKEAAA